ncbi:hypothetical protein D3C72_917610 [compost metagenome]
MSTGRPNRAATAPANAQTEWRSPSLSTGTPRFASSTGTPTTPDWAMTRICSCSPGVWETSAPPAPRTSVSPSTSPETSPSPRPQAADTSI